MMIPSAPGIAVVKNSTATLDYSLVTEGYVMAEYHGGEDRMCQMSISCNGEQQHYTILHGKGMRSYPLCYGDGLYRIQIIRAIAAGSKQASTVVSRSIDVALRDQHLPYLYPNTYCWFDEESECVRIAREICDGAETDYERWERIYWWIINNLVYDRELAAQVASGEVTTSWWLPHPDKVIEKLKGICWEYASLCAAMCRVVGIPCKICVGHAGAVYHSWTEIWLESGGSIQGIDYMPGDWTRTDLTFLDSGNGSAAITAYVNDSSKYSVEYYG